MTNFLPVFWLCGPSGVGKSTVAWELFAGWPGAGYLDIDQIGMCFPEIPADRGRTVLQGRILGRTVAHFRAAGARCLIVSGCLDAELGVHTQYLPDAALRVLRLRCDLPELDRRLAARARPGEARDLALRGAEELDHSGLPYECLDTSGRTAAEVLAAVRERWPLPPARRPGRWPAAQPAPPGEIVWVCGATATGKSTVGFTVYLTAQRAGHTAAFVDLQQLGFLRPAPPDDPGNHRLRAANLAAAWRNFHAHGASRMVVVGHVDHPGELGHYIEALAPTPLTLYRLHAGPDELRDRIRQRAAGGGPPIAGDELRGQPEPVLDRAHEAAVAQAAALEHTDIGDVRLDTAGRTPDDIATEIAHRVGW